MTAWAWSALALFAGWAVTAFGIRSVIQARRTGDTGFRGLSGRPGSASWWAGVLFVLALLGGGAAPIASLTGLPDLPSTGWPLLRGAGLVITLAGITATLLAQSAMGTSWRVGVDAGERTVLVTSGMFAAVRNPVFTAMAVTATGLALMVPNAVALLALTALVTAVQLQVRIVEEPYLRSVHGEAYDAYARRAGRFWPGIGRRTA
ncbi:isoprenylcysteine carboxylmethyltransferase family protein [Streptomyces sp. LHD-70]|uniref:methyltransferase family protein n=1 Tax=Streptomyces sp. LHD-70 TaxID=3072140 RepID=UPI00280FD084|nr:isoprenylcysteine carboxylmethyltransferase family protein [Streptomyces sp. LHD-70]MDQ8703877.1 isoprenylcysteine carboxylmethyltransferase family protein [Streptomyces sp. LHD-70]